MVKEERSKLQHTQSQLVRRKEFQESCGLRQKERFLTKTIDILISRAPFAFGIIARKPAGEKEEKATSISSSLVEANRKNNNNNNL